MNKMEVKFDDCGRYPSWTGCGSDFWRLLDRIHHYLGSAVSYAERNCQIENIRILWNQWYCGV